MISLAFTMSSPNICELAILAFDGFFYKEVLFVFLYLLGYVYWGGLIGYCRCGVLDRFFCVFWTDWIFWFSFWVIVLIVVDMWCGVIYKEDFLVCSMITEGGTTRV